MCGAINRQAVGPANRKGAMLKNVKEREGKTRFGLPTTELGYEVEENNSVTIWVYGIGSTVYRDKVGNAVFSQLVDFLENTPDFMRNFVYPIPKGFLVDIKPICFEGLIQRQLRVLTEKYNFAGPFLKSFMMEAEKNPDLNNSLIACLEDWAPYLVYSTVPVAVYDPMENTLYVEDREVYVQEDSYDCFRRLREQIINEGLKGLRLWI